MRLLTNDETFAVADGTSTARRSSSPNGNSGNSDDPCSKITSRWSRDRCGNSG